MGNFRILSEDEMQKYEGGFAIGPVLAAIFTYLPMGISAIGSIIGVAKMASANKGEIKTKGGLGVKWDNSESRPMLMNGSHYCI
ncbi:hypothetical protein [Metamycoplasma buccale]|uniref:hypothetical protein n=1 Tax=Metamycoplasma buccale TaxID=55602 RepID=UPI00398EAC2F